MKGTDCTPRQLEAASEFLRDRGWPVDLDRASIDRDQVTRLLAWYGAMRFIGARDGIGGTLEEPGTLDVVRRS